jgi:predicted transposase YdaD
MAAGQPHDALFKAVFSRLEHAHGLLAQVLPPTFVRHLDWSTFAQEPATFVDAALAQRHSDLLFSIRTVDGEPLLLYLLVEHQSEPDRWMALRLHSYVDRIWQRWRTRTPTAHHLPRILPVVVHHGAAGWREPRSLHDLYGPAPPGGELIAACLPEQRFLLLDLGAEPTETLERRRMTDVGRAALLLLQRARSSPDILADLRRWLYLFARILGGPSGTQDLGLLLEYVLKATPVEPTRVRQLIEGHLGEAGREAYMLTGAQQLVEQGRVEGRVEGRAEGRAEVLLLQLSNRFGAVDAASEERVRTATSADLDRWAVRILGAQTLEEILR